MFAIKQLEMRYTFYWKPLNTVYFTIKQPEMRYTFYWKPLNTVYFILNNHDLTNL